MNADYVQNLRYKLQKRVRRLKSVDFGAFHATLQQFWAFLNAHPALLGILEDLARRYPSSEGEAVQVVEEQKALVCGDEGEEAALAYFVIRKCVQTVDDANVELHIGMAYTGSGEFQQDVDAFRSRFTEPLYEYIDEQLDDVRAILALLRRYKHRCEWFRRKALHDRWKNNTQGGEWTLKLDLFEYLHEQGVDFSIDPWSASGKPDLVAAQDSDDPLIADAKIFAGQRSVSNVVHGFNQIHTYTRDYNEPVGYLVIFKTCPEDLKLSLTGAALGIPFMVYNNKTIFMLVIDIADYEATASKRGTLKAYEIAERDLVRMIQEGEVESAGVPETADSGSSTPPECGE